jgi:D-serine deaminase-like pyridoxal phosphate-dependent protein
MPHPDEFVRAFGQLREIETPAIIVDADVLDANLRRMANLAATAQLDLRPHVKTHKSVKVARQQLALGARGITASKPSEAAVFAEHGFDDIFMAFPPVGAQKLDRIEPLLAEEVLTVGIDDVAIAEPLARRGRQRKRSVPVMFEVDVGMHRAGRPWGRAAAEEAALVAAIPGIDLRGVFTHEGHAHNWHPSKIGDLADEVTHRLTTTAKLLRTTGHPCPTVSVGSTLTTAHLQPNGGLTEMRPGVYAYGDVRTVEGGAATWRDCALTVLATVVSRPNQQTVIIDAGTKTLSPALTKSGTYGYVANLEGAHFVRCSEEHGTLDLKKPSLQPLVGTRIHVVPARAGVVVNTSYRTHQVAGVQHLRSVPTDASLCEL